MDIEKMSREQLQSALLKLTKATQEQFGPLLYHLREKMKRPGRKGEGWGFWVRNHLPFSLTTATHWANEYGRKNHLPVAPKRTSSKSVRGEDEEPDVFQFVIVRPDWLTKTKAKELQRVIRLAFTTPEAFQTFFDAVMKAAHVKALSAHA